MEPQNKGMTIDIQVSKSIGYVFYIDGKIVLWEEMTRQQQIKALNSFIQGYKLFERFLKEE